MIGSGLALPTEAASGNAASVTYQPEVQTYEELLKNGDFSLFKQESEVADGWKVEQDPQGAGQAILNNKAETGKQNMIVFGLNNTDQIRLIQEVAATGKQSYGWKAWHASTSTSAEVFWEAVFLSADNQVIGRERLLQPTRKAKYQTGETPEGTSRVRIQLVATGKGGSAVVSAQKASFIVLKKTPITPAPNPSGPSKYTYTYDANGRLMLVDTGKGKIRYRYDANGNLLQKTREGFAEPPVTQPSKPEFPEQELAALPDIGELDGGSYSFYSVNDAASMNGITLSFKGWYLSEKPIEKVQYYWNDNLLIGESTYGLKNDTVYFDHPEYENRNLGFKLNVKMSNYVQQLDAREYKISAVIKHKDGSSHKLENKIKISVLKIPTS